MQIVTKRGDVEIYRQVMEDSKTLNATVGVLMQQPAGDKIVTVVTNNGHDLTFRSDVFDRDRIVRAVNGIIARQKKAE
jgi:hypothetical protein